VLGREKWGAPTRVLVTPSESVWDAAPSLLVQRRKATSSPAKTREDLRVLHPQPLGMDLNGANQLHTVQRNSLIIAPSARRSPKLAKETRDGVEAWRLDYQTKIDGAAVSVWLVPSQGFGLVGAEHRDAKKSVVTTVDCRLKQYPSGGVWYPERVVRK